MELHVMGGCAAPGHIHTVPPPPSPSPSSVPPRASPPGPHQRRLLPCQPLEAFHAFQRVVSQHHIVPARKAQHVGQGQGGVALCRHRCTHACVPQPVCCQPAASPFTCCPLNTHPPTHPPTHPRSLCLSQACQRPLHRAVACRGPHRVHHQRQGSVHPVQLQRLPHAFGAVHAVVAGQACRRRRREGRTRCDVRERVQTQPACQPETNTHRSAARAAADRQCCWGAGCGAPCGAPTLGEAVPPRAVRRPRGPRLQVKDVVLAALAKALQPLLNAAGRA